MVASSYTWIAIGVAVGVVVILAGSRSRRGGTKAAKRGPTGLGWSVLALGIAASVLAFKAADAFQAPDGRAWLRFAIVTGVATVVAGVGALIKWDRRWPVWTGMALAIVPSLPLPMFGLGYVVFAAGGCGGHMGDLASELAPPSGIEVELMTDGMGSCWADTAADVPEAQLVEHYEAEFEAHGWQVLPPPPGGHMIGGEIAIDGSVAEKDGILFSVVARKAPDGTPVYRIYFLDVGTE